MSKLYVTVDRDSRKQITGGAHRDITVHARGWDSGVETVVKNCGDCILYQVYKTGGSNRPSQTELIHEHYEKI